MGWEKAEVEGQGTVPVGSRAEEAEHSQHGWTRGRIHCWMEHKMTAILCLVMGCGSFMQHPRAVQPQKGADGMAEAAGGPPTGLLETLLPGWLPIVPPWDDFPRRS